MYSIWKHSWRDCFPLCVTLAQLGTNFWLAATWEQRSPGEFAVLWPVMVLVFWYNPIVSTHNFLHTPFFRFRWLNNLYRGINSINL